MKSMLKRVLKFARRIYIQTFNPLVQVGPQDYIRPSTVIRVVQLNSVRTSTALYLTRVRIDLAPTRGREGDSILLEREFIETVLERLGQPKWLSLPKPETAAPVLDFGGKSDVGTA